MPGRSVCSGVPLRHIAFSRLFNSRPSSAFLPLENANGYTLWRHMTDDLSTRAINTIRFLSADAVQQANSGHPGLPMGSAAMAFVLWTRHLHHNPQDPKWPGRDRFVLSGGHGSMLLYSLLHLTGYDLSSGGDQALPPVGEQDPRPSRIWPYSRRRNDHRPSRAGLRDRRRHGYRPGPHGRRVQSRAL